MGILEQVDAAIVDFQNRYKALATGNVQESDSTRSLADALIQEVIEKSCSLLDTEAGTFFILNDQKKELRAAATKGASKDDLSKITIKIGIGLVGHVAWKGVSQVSNDPDKDLRFNKGFDRKTGFKTRNLLAVSVKAEGRVVAAIEVINKRNAEFASGEETHLEKFSEGIGPHLANAVRLTTLVAR